MQEKQNRGKSRKKGKNEENKNSVHFIFICYFKLFLIIFNSSV